MKVIKHISVFALAAMLLVSCKDTTKDGNIETPENGTVADTIQKETAANLETTSFKIDGMTCAIGCAKTIESKLAGLDGVENAKVDFDTKTATISYDAGKQTPETIVGTVEKIADGTYKVSEVKNSADKAMLYKADQEPKKKTEKKKDKKKAKKEEKASCASGEKKSCCAGEAKKSCHSESTTNSSGGSL
jgi:copper chaperone CopZ